MLRNHPARPGAFLRSGIPGTASPEMARSILERLARKSGPYRTEIGIENGVQVIHANSRSSQ
jgi:hypothetical protein